MSNETRAAIRPVKNRVEDDLLARPGVTGVDIAQKISGGKPTGELSIVVFVDKKVPLSRLSKADLIPKEIDGVVTDVQEVIFELQTPAWEPLDAIAQIDTGAYPTLVGGISMGPSRTFFLEPPAVEVAGNYTMVGTLGALVRDNGTGATMALTNFHVAAVDTTWAAGQRMTQPGRPDGGNPNTQEFGALTRAVLSEHVDGAVVTLDAGRAWQASVQGIGGVAGTAAAVLNEHVRKRGRTTELREGTVQSLDFTVTIDYGDGLGLRTLRNQIRIDPANAALRFSDRGDSGSVIMNDSREVIGLLFGGARDGSMTFANPIADVLSELNVTMLTDRPLIFPTRTIICRPTLACPVSLSACPSLFRCPSVEIACLPSRVDCATRLCPTNVCPTIGACPTLRCPTLGRCPSLACGFDPRIPGRIQGAMDEDYGYGEPEPTYQPGSSYEAGYADGYAAGVADSQAGALAAQEQADVSSPELNAVTQGVCLDNGLRYPSRRCPTVATCPTELRCPTDVRCPSRVPCPSVEICPSERICPSRVDCPTRWTFGYCWPSGGAGRVEDRFREGASIDATFWAGYLAAMEQMGGDAQQ